MSAPKPLADAYAELASLTPGMTVADWHDFTSLPPDAQGAALAAYRAQGWAPPPDVVGKMLQILGVAVQVAGDVTGVAGAVGALAALKSLV